MRCLFDMWYWAQIRRLKGLKDKLGIFILGVVTLSEKVSAVRVMTSALVWIVSRRRRRRRNDTRVRERGLAFIADDSDQSLKRFFSGEIDRQHPESTARFRKCILLLLAFVNMQGVGSLSNMCFAREIYPAFLFSLKI